jgi:uncharacterized membrane protein
MGNNQRGVLYYILMCLTPITAVIAMSQLIDEIDRKRHENREKGNLKRNFTYYIIMLLSVFGIFLALIYTISDLVWYIKRKRVSKNKNETVKSENSSLS